MSARGPGRPRTTWRRRRPGCCCSRSAAAWPPPRVGGRGPEGQWPGRSRGQVRGAASEATWQVGGELGRAPRGPAAPRRSPRPGAARRPFVSPARAPPGDAGPRPASRAGEQGARAAPTPPGAARAGPHLPGPRGALGSAARGQRAGRGGAGAVGTPARGRHRAGTFGPETGLGALRRELFGEPVSDGRAAGLRAPRTDASCKRKFSARAPGGLAWRAAPFHRRCCRFPNGLTPARCPGDPSGLRGPTQWPPIARGPPRGPAAWGPPRGRAARSGLGSAHPVGDRGLRTFLCNFWCVPRGGVEVRRTQET